jgi:hypothetical protein
MSMTVILAAQAIASGMMAGIIWFVQAVHYPLFAAVDTADGAAYAQENQRRTVWVVLPPMLVEAAASVWIASHRPRGRACRHYDGGPPLALDACSPDAAARPAGPRGACHYDGRHPGVEQLVTNTPLDSPRRARRVDACRGWMTQRGARIHPGEQAFCHEGRRKPFGRSAFSPWKARDKNPFE